METKPGEIIKIHSTKSNNDYCLHLTEKELDMVLYCLENSSACDYVDLYENLKALRNGKDSYKAPNKTLILQASIKCPHCKNGVSISLQTQIPAKPE